MFPKKITGKYNEQGTRGNSHAEITSTPVTFYISQEQENL